MKPEVTYHTWNYYNPKTLAPLSSDYIGQLRQQSLDLANQAQQAQAAKQFDPRSLISEGLGVAGAVGGGIIGGPVGAGIGGAAFSGLGQFLENQAMGKPQDVGQIAGEAALGGLFGFGPVRAAKTVLGVPAKALGVGTAGAAGATEAAGKSAADLLKMSTQGGLKGAIATGVQNARGYSLGIVKGVEVPGFKPLTQVQSNNLYNFLEQTVGNTSGGPAKASFAVESFKNTLGKDITNNIVDNAVKVSGSQIAKDFKALAKNSVMGDLTTTKTYQGIYNNLRKLGTSADTWKLRRTLDGTINKFAKGTTQLTTQNQFLGGEARNLLNNVLKNAHEGLGTQFANYNNATKLEAILNGAAKSGRNALQGGVQSTILKAGPIKKAVREVANVGANVVGAGTGAKPGVLGGVRAGLGRSAQALAAPSQGIGLEQALTLARTNPQALAGLAGRVTGPAVGRVGLGVPIAREATGFNQPPAPPTTEQLNAQAKTIESQYALAPEVAAYQAQQAAQESPYPASNLLEDIKKDPQNSAKYIQFYNDLNKALGIGTSSLNVTKVTSQDYTNAMNGMKALNAYVNELKSNPNALNVGARIPGQDIKAFGIGSDISRTVGTGKLNSLGYQMIENWLRIQTGAAAPESEVRAYMKMYLPAPGDSEATRIEKLSSLQYAFDSTIKMANNQSLTSQSQDAVNALLGGQ